MQHKIDHSLYLPYLFWMLTNTSIFFFASVRGSCNWSLVMELCTTAILRSSNLMFMRLASSVAPRGKLCKLSSYGVMRWLPPLQRLLSVDAASVARMAATADAEGVGRKVAAASIAAWIFVFVAAAQCFAPHDALVFCPLPQKHKLSRHMRLLKRFL